jgi:hypothetical protein
LQEHPLTHYEKQEKQPIPFSQFTLIALWYILFHFVFEPEKGKAIENPSTAFPSSHSVILYCSKWDTVLAPHAMGSDRDKKDPGFPTKGYLDFFKWRHNCLQTTGFFFAWN